MRHGPWRFEAACTASIMSAAFLFGITSAGATSSPTSQSLPGQEVVTGGPTGTYVVPPGIHKIQHVIIIEQENRSFDSYFGTYPSADGLPKKNGTFTVCVPNPATKGCTRPYHDASDVNGGGPHGMKNAIADVNGGKMNGFIRQRDAAPKCPTIPNPACNLLPVKEPDVMGYHTAAEIPNYWTYAKDFVLNDHMFEPVNSWSLPDHLYLVSGWSARCKDANPSSCINAPANPATVVQAQVAVIQAMTQGTSSVVAAWTDLTWLLYQNHVSWAYYVQTGVQPDCANDSADVCTKARQQANTPGMFNPLPMFEDVQQTGQVKNIEQLSAYFTAAKAGTLPAVSWIAPSVADSEHPPSSVHQGQAYVTAVINAAMESPNWDSTAIFLQWDDWGGFYDNVVPPRIDANGYGLRVPALVISPYAKKGFVDHQTLSSDAYLKFIEDDFLGGARLNPKTDGRPDPRPDVRENQKLLGNLTRDFNFNQVPRPPVLLATNPPTDSPSIPKYFAGKGRCVGCTKTPPSI